MLVRQSKNAQARSVARPGGGGEDTMEGWGVRDVFLADRSEGLLNGSRKKAAAPIGDVPIGAAKTERA